MRKNSRAESPVGGEDEDRESPHRAPVHEHEDERRHHRCREQTCGEVGAGRGAHARKVAGEIAALQTTVEIASPGALQG